MSRRTGHARPAALPLVGVLLPCLLILTVLVAPASAAFTACGSDPVVSLSDGTQLDLSATISADLSTVQQVVYVVHVPAGVQELAVVNTDGLMGLKESIHVTANNPPGTYDTETTVFTSQGRVAVTAQTTVVSALGTTLGSHAISGMSQQDLSLGFTSSL